jgi:hypothetical protein
MSQSRIGSFIETIVNIAIGFLTSLVLMHVLMPLYGYQIPIEANLQITLIFTVTSILRGYLVRRTFVKFFRN